MKESSKQVAIAIAAGITWLTVLVGSLVVGNERIQASKNRQIEETFYVATPAGEAFQVDAMHKCGPTAMRKAAIHATQMQTQLMNFTAAHDVLKAVTMDYARIYNGNITNRCEITGVVFTNITNRGEQ